jgi:uncharacterized protein (DUF1330 family)
MAAYVIANFHVTDPEAFAAYAAAAPATVEAHGGAYLARGGETELWEGEASLGRVVILRFPNVEAAHTWYNSAEYAQLRDLRLRAAHGPLIVTVGAEPS